jgi:hypothetical protein
VAKTADWPIRLNERQVQYHTEGRQRRKREQLQIGQNTQERQLENI